MSHTWNDAPSAELRKWGEERLEKELRIAEVEFPNTVWRERLESELRFRRDVVVGRPSP